MSNNPGEEVKTNKSEIIDAEKKVGYTLFARAYLILSYRGSEEVFKKIKEGRFDNPFGEMVPDWVYEFNFLLAPVIFNLKHAIEIFLKGIARLTEGDFEEKHDLNLLFKDIERKTKKYNIEGELQAVKELIEKYYENRFMEDKIEGSFTMEDRLNDVFRYPDNKAKFRLYFSFIFPKFKEKDLEELQKDIKRLYALFYKIGKKILGYPRPTPLQAKEIFKDLKKETDGE